MPELPLARSQDLIVEALEDELLVFDTTTSRAYSLNTSAAAVWQACDGARSGEQIAEHCRLDQAAVELALESLGDSKLLADYTPPEERVSRRAVIRRLAITGASVGVAVPVIRSIVAPSAAVAGSTSRNPKNFTDCKTAASCSAGSVCGTVVPVCLRPRGASCYNTGGSSGNSGCSEGPQAITSCPSTGTCP